MVFVLSAFILFTRAEGTKPIETEKSENHTISYEDYELTKLIITHKTEDTTELETQNVLIEYSEQTTQKNVYETEQTINHKEENENYEYDVDKYAIATKIWDYLRNDMGLNKYVSAGIMGNIMTECGGQTLDIQPYVRSYTGHYGICQWSPVYCEQIIGKDLNGQLEFLKSTIKPYINQMGYRYYKGFNYEKFVSITDEKIAAEAFAYAYEGCGTGNCSQRRLDHATTALNYFEGE